MADNDPDDPKLSDTLRILQLQTLSRELTYAHGRGCRKQDGIGVNRVRVAIPPVHICAPLKGTSSKGCKW